MRFSLFKSTALALVATAAYAKDGDVPHKLRGALKISGGQDVVKADAVAENQPAQIAHHSHHHSHAKKKKTTTKDVKKEDDDAAKEKKTTTAKKTKKEQHDFFPSDNNKMNEAAENYDSWTDRSDRRNRNTNRNFDSSRSYQKRNGNASQKRQNQRDTRRFDDNPNRSQAEEQRERERKSRQGRRSGNMCRDPSEPGCGGNDNFPRNREAKRNVNCRARDAGCNYHRVDPGNEPNRRRANNDMDCLDDCYRRTRNASQERACDRTCAMDSVFSITEFKRE